MTDAGWLPLTSAQRGLFFAHHLDPANPCHTTAEVVELDAPVDPVRLAAAVEAAHAEFEQLRTVFRLTPAGPEQRVVTTANVLEVVDVPDDAAAQAWLDADLARPLDLGTGPCRTALLTLPDGRCWWYHAAHHVVLDGYGAQQLLRRVADLYDGAAPVPPVPLTDLVEANRIDQEAVASDDFWHARLDEMTGVVSPAGREASAAPRALRASRALDDAAQARLVEAAARLGESWPDVFVAALGAYVARFMGTDETRLGVPLMNRTRPGAGVLPAATTACTAMNVLPVRVPADGTVAETVRATAQDHAEVRAHPLHRQEDLARVLRTDGRQLFGVQANLVPFGLSLRFGDARGSVRNLTAGPVEDMTVCLRGTPGRRRSVRLEIDANPRLYGPDEAHRHLERIAAWLETWAAAPGDALVTDLALTTPDELDAVVHRFNATHVDRSSSTLGRRFLDQAARTPDAVAVVDGETTRTYAELARRAGALATDLRGRGVGPGDVVGVALERSAGLIEAVHAIALIGAVYLPLDPDLPEARIASMVEDAGAVVVGPADLLTADSPTTPTPPDDPDAPAYLLFTSGSTGRPKGVLVGHRAIDNRLAWMQHRLPIGPGDRVLHKTPISFDVSVWELFWPLQTGATLVIAPPGAHRDPRAIAELVDRHEVDVLHFVPSMLRAHLADRVAAAATPSVRHVVTSGEALTPGLVAGCADVFGVPPVNLYGPTEAAIDVTHWECAPDEVTVPIGRPVWNTACFVLDDRMRPRPVGATGELWLAGVQLADGYVGRPDLTAGRFVEAPAELRTHGDRLYRTGDLAAWRSDGALTYLGRVDDQVKVRGQRIELGEVEAAVAEQVDACAAAMVGDLLVVWFVAPNAVKVDDLRERAAAVLPASVLPHHWIRVPSVPLTTSGKVDRGALVRSWEPPADAGGDSPSGLLEQRVCGAFADVLGLPRVGADRDFFALGGDSLRVLRLLDRIEADLGVELRLADVFDAPTPARLARRVAAGGPAAETGEILTLRRGAPDEAPLILLPPAGGLGWCYASLLPALPPGLGVHTIQAPGLEQGVPEPVDDLESLAKRQLAAIREIVGTGPFHVAGWSLGGMAAHTVAAQARADGQEVGAVVLLDAYPADQWRHLPDPTEAEALRGVLRLGGLESPDGTDLDRETAVRMLRESGSAVGRLPERTLAGCLASVAEAARVTRTSQHAVLEGDATVVVAARPRPEDWLWAEGWRPYVSGDLRSVTVDASHGDLVRAPVAHEVGGIIAALVGDA
ncbi:non-ribosomal peptide synthetase [Aeromicrobium choanae]|uniref:Enterobactin synthetase component F n=1 Tax=Aeromicrobium choanae TaxID=1736691 RepID=A0A1T4YRU4_9ACTN|nr:non-ribosomal peptide synthetase [Aeromicrobium choanae]SKB04574.1 enterobactin synthetase component F [Aeromicrobium choanae]